MTAIPSVLRALMAVGGEQETRFYAKLFKKQDPEKFALIVLDSRCLKNPLLEAFVSDIQILAELGLQPVLLIGALDQDRARVKFLTSRLCRALDGVGVKLDKLNCATYNLMSGIGRTIKADRIPVLEMTEISGRMELPEIISGLDPNKVMFIQPSGSLRRDGERIPMVNLDRLERDIAGTALTEGQNQFIQTVSRLSGEDIRTRSYVMASPLNLLAELFTIKGAGTVVRRGAHIASAKALKNVDHKTLAGSIVSGFGRSLKADFWESEIETILHDSTYQGGAIVIRSNGLSYLSKFWVVEAAKGDGIARDIWDELKDHHDALFWRSREHNPFNAFYMRECDGMQRQGDWRIFWRGVAASKLSGAIQYAANAPDDFI